MFNKRVSQKRDTRSTGILDIDVLLGDIHNKDIILLMPEEGARYHTAIHRIFISKGLEDKERVIHVSVDNTVLNIPDVVRNKSGVHTRVNAMEIGNKTDSRVNQSNIDINSAQSRHSAHGLGDANPITQKISWRYKNISKVSNSTNIHSDTNRLIPGYNVQYNMKISHPLSDTVLNISDTNVHNVLDILEEEMKKGVTRISFSSLLFYNTPDVDTFLFSLRRLVRNYNSICLMSVPVYIYSISYRYFDLILKLHSNMLNIPKYTGVIECVKSRVHNMHKYAIIYNSTGIKIEKIVIPPE
ncbi:hypothetical protein NEIG_00755 [Nematocida sp. ERTm5]|nr:hypothetical protein NEIRO03_0511 [Nematocida sp. AWRm78]OAG31455.1 hypothetical protein NEIG_00755 [Nematocida sp. ERTm5]